MRYKHLLVVMLLVLLAACGQKKALYLPAETATEAEESESSKKQPSQTREEGPRS